MSNDKLIRVARKAVRLGRGALYRAAIRIAGGECGRGLQVEAHATFRYGVHAGINFGQRVYIGRGVVIDVPSSAVLELGNGVKIMHYTVIAASERIEIGAGTQVAESCSVRDADHGKGTESLSMADHLITTPTTIGDGAWIARGVAVLRGARIGCHAVVGANSVVTSKYPVPDNATAVGAPARVISPAG